MAPKFGRSLLLFILALALPFGARAEESLDCLVNRQGQEPLPLMNRIVDGEGVVSNTNNPLGLGLDASLARTSFLFVLQDDAKQQRVAFTGTPLSLAWDGARIGTSTMGLGCRKKSTEPAKEIVSVARPDVSYFVCLLDDATFEKGAVTKVQRAIQTVSSAITFRLPLKVNAESEKYAFSVAVNDLDPLNGLSVKLTDKAAGETVTFAGPPKSIVTSFMLGFTQGDRATSAKFLRLGCVFTDEPKPFLEDLKK